MKTRNDPSIAPQSIEPKAVSPRQPQYAWEMTLEQFQQTYFPELRAGDSADHCDRACPCANRCKAA